MNTPKGGLRVASVLFGLMALGQLWRVFARPEVLGAGAPMPIWPSVVALIILVSLCIWLWRLSGRA